MSKILYITFFCIFLSSAVFPYGIPTHEFLTKNAVLALNKYLLDQDLKDKIIDDQMLQVMVKGNKREDQHLIRKGLNQHFYHPCKQINGIKTFTRRYDRLVFRLSRLERKGFEKKKRKIFLTIGRITHYLQDMSVPPHVVPIFHTGKDKFDQYQFDVSEVALPTDHVEPLLQVPEESIREMLLNGAIKTIQTLDEPIELNCSDGSFRPQTWSLFWSGENSDGFGSYGVFDNSFGDTSLTVHVNDRDSISCKIEKVEYDAYFKQQAWQAQQYTIRVLWMILKDK